jgi:hypothetical protein
VGGKDTFQQGIKRTTTNLGSTTRINGNIATGLYKERFIRLMLEENKERQNGLFVQLKEDMMKNIVPIRILPGKPRRWKYFNKYKCKLKPGF